MRGVQNEEDLQKTILGCFGGILSEPNGKKGGGNADAKTSATTLLNSFGALLQKQANTEDQSLKNKSDRKTAKDKTVKKFQKAVGVTKFLNALGGKGKKKLPEKEIVPISTDLKPKAKIKMRMPEPGEPSESKKPWVNPIKKTLDRQKTKVGASRNSVEFSYIMKLKNFERSRKNQGLQDLTTSEFFDQEGREQTPGTGFGGV